MSARWINSLPESFEEAERSGLKKVTVDFDAMGEEEKQQWRSISSIDGRPKFIIVPVYPHGSKCCYLDENTGEYNRCVQVPDNYHRRK
jgi:hypothetical protein